MKKPIIGITCDYDWNSNEVRLYEGYYRAIFEAGGLPFLIPYTSVNDTDEILFHIDGLLLSGGQDVDPYFFGEKPYPELGKLNPVRDKIELSLCRKAVENNIPVLGICRGIQVMNIAMGGSIYQDLKVQCGKKELLNHYQNAPKWYGIHNVKIDTDSQLYRIMETDIVRANSFHHQAVKKVASIFKTSAFSEDGIVEAIESINNSFVIGIQWHPEHMWKKQKVMLTPFRAFVESSNKKQ